MFRQQRFAEISFYKFTGIYAVLGDQADGPAAQMEGFSIVGGQCRFAAIANCIFSKCLVYGSTNGHFCYE